MRRRTTPIATALLALVFASAGCANGEREDAPYAAQFSAAMAGSSAYVREILDDGEITPAEYKDAQQHVLECLDQAGITAAYSDNGAGYNNLTITGETSISQDNAQAACEDQWMGEIDALHVATIINPDNKNFDSLIAQCLVRNNLAPQGFTGKDYTELIRDNSGKINATPTAGSVTRIQLPVTGDITIPDGASLSDPQAIACEMNPSQR